MVVALLQFFQHITGTGGGGGGGETGKHQMIVLLGGLLEVQVVEVQASGRSRCAPALAGGYREIHHHNSPQGNDGGSGIKTDAQGGGGGGGLGGAGANASGSNGGAGGGGNTPIFGSPQGPWLGGTPGPAPGRYFSGGGGGGVYRWIWWWNRRQQVVQVEVVVQEQHTITVIQEQQEVVILVEVEAELLQDQVVEVQDHLVVQDANYDSSFNSRWRIRW